MSMTCLTSTRLPTKEEIQILWLEFLSVIGVKTLAPTLAGLRKNSEAVSAKDKFFATSILFKREWILFRLSTRLLDLAMCFLRSSAQIGFLRRTRGAVPALN